MLAGVHSTTSATRLKWLIFQQQIRRTWFQIPPGFISFKFLENQLRKLTQLGCEGPNFKFTWSSNCEEIFRVSGVLVQVYLGLDRTWMGGRLGAPGAADKNQSRAPLQEHVSQGRQESLFKSNLPFCDLFTQFQFIVRCTVLVDCTFAFHVTWAQ